MQRAQMIANQITQLANDARQLREMGRHLTQLELQLRHMTRAAQGELGALAEPFSQLAAAPVGLVGDRMRWGPDFAGDAADMVRAARALGDGRSLTELWRGQRRAIDPLDEADLHDLLRDYPPDAATRAIQDHRRQAAARDQQRVLDYAALDAADALAATLESARASFADLTANGNLSNTALQQATLAAQLSQGRVHAAVGQAMAFDIVQRASRSQQAEIAHLEHLGEWRAGRLRANRMARAMRDATLRDRQALRDGLLLRVPSFFMARFDR